MDLKNFISFVKQNAKTIDFVLLILTLITTLIFMGVASLWDEIFSEFDNRYGVGLEEGGLTILYIFVPYIFWRITYHYWLKN